MEKLRILLLIFFGTFLSGIANANSRPNFVFILVDDLRAGILGCEGHPFSKTPNIDRIGREGAVFRNAFVTTPLCSPARASFLTGQYASAHQVLNNGNYQARSLKLVTFPLLLQKAGYASAFIGKWHMGNHDEPKPGFDHWISFRGQGVYENPMLNVNGKQQRQAGYITDILNKHAVEFIERKHEKPFLLYLSHKAVHGPFTPAQRHKTLYTNETVMSPPSVNDSLEGKLAIIQMRELENRKSRPPENHFFEKTLRAHLRCMKSIDEGVAEIFAVLEKTGKTDDTVVIFTSDNGYLLGEHGLGDKRWAYEESIKIPMLMRYPPLIKAGTKVDRLALNIDIAPTLLDLTGVGIPDNMHGKSLMPLINGQTSQWREAAFFEYFVDRQYPRFPKWQASRTAEWKYIHYPELAGADELYDLKTDPYELKNLASNGAMRQRLEQMKTQLGRLQSEIK